MKIQKNKLTEMREKINAVLDKHGRQKVIDSYNRGAFPRSDKVTDLQKRFCFDLFYAAGLGKKIQAAYPNATDAHIYTALRQVCPKVEAKT